MPKRNSKYQEPGQGAWPLSAKKVRYAVVGLGYIAQVAVLPAFQHARENSELVALVSGDATKRAQLAKKYKVNTTYSYEQFSECLESGLIDAVYIALPNNMHRAYTEAAARAGVHILCEKPMAVTEQECEAMIEATSRANVKLMIAYRLHFEKGNLAAVSAVRDGKIGDPRIFRSGFCQQVRTGNSRLQDELGGGPLYDIGVYCINAARYLFRAEPEEVFAYSATREQDSRFKEIDEMYAALLRFPDARLASFTCSFGAADRSTYEVIGTKGVVKMDPAYEMVGDLKSEITIEGRTQKATYKKRDQFGPELVYFSKCILENMEPEPGGKEGLADVRIIQALLESQQKDRPVRTSSVGELTRPTEEQEIHKPPVGKPHLVKAAPPSK
ncbi:MAG: Gfo/Idh/MocA family oxidoreductase [Alloacidobacterium sp.]|jgi:glucose-fructose oxidoreductase